MPFNQHVQVDAELGGMKITLVNESTAPEDRDGVLDQFAQSIGRQKAKIDLGMAIQNLLNTKRDIVNFPTRIAEFSKTRALERIRMRDAWEQAHFNAGKRAEFAPSRAQLQALKDFDAGTATKVAEFEGNLESAKQIIAIHEASIERLRGSIRGEDQDEYRLKEAAAVELLAAE